MNGREMETGAIPLPTPLSTPSVYFRGKHVRISS
jgi:hypothetical protein